MKRSKTGRIRPSTALPIVLVAVAWAALAGPAIAGIELEARVWAPSLTGKGLVGEATDGRVIDLAGDLGLDSGEFVEGRFIWKPLKALMLRIAYMPLSFNGDALIEEEFEFGGVVFPIEIQVLSDLRIDYGRFAAAWMFGLADDKLRVGPLVEAKGFYGDASLVGRFLFLETIAAEEDFVAGFGSAGLILDYKPIPTLHLFAEGTIDVGVSEGGATDIELGIKFFPLKLLSVSGGYRVIDIEYRDGDDFVELDLSGFFLGASLRF